MESSGKLDRVTGTTDVLPGDYLVYDRLKRSLLSLFESHGYQGIDPPVLEPTELHVRKAGGGIVARLYAFTDHGKRAVCLRPEMTASVVRAYIAGMRGQPLPARLFYCGPVFRYEKPQRGRFRQFTQVGVELIGAAGPFADAELIHLACEGLERAGLQEYRVRLGHVGVVQKLLDGLGLDPHVRAFFLESLEDLGREGRGLDYVAGRLEGLGLSNPESALSGPLAQAVTDALAGRPECEAVAVATALLSESRVPADSRRAPEDIARRLLTRFRVREQSAKIARALEFLKQLVAIHGPPPQIFEDVRRLLDAHHLDPAPLADLERVVGFLAAYGVPPGRIQVDLGFGRGLQYYTGLIFEIHSPRLGPAGELCGGGRYDELVVALGGTEGIPASGFAFGLERVLLALDAERAAPHAPRPAHVLVLPVGVDSQEYAVTVAERLRAQGLRVQLDVRERRLKAALAHVEALGVPYAVMVGDEERDAGCLVLRDMAAHEQRSVPLEDIPAAADAIRKGLAADE